MVRFTTAASLLVAGSLSTSTNAFTVGSSAFRARPTFSPNSSSSTSSTALSMNLFDRFTRVAKANIDSVLKGLEDPEKIMNQAVEDMQNDLVKIRQSYAEVTATQRRLLKQKEQADAVAEDWYKRAQLALKAANEGLAKEALTRRQTAMDEAAGLQQQVDAQAASIDKLYEGMQTLEKSILESKAKKEQMIARARTAQSTQKVNDMMSGMSGKTSMDAFKRMEDKVEALEASAEVSAEMGSLSSNAALPGSVEDQFKQLEAASSVDDELNKLKGLLGASKDEGASSASSSSSSSSSSSKPSTPVDDELAKLKRDAGL